MDLIPAWMIDCAFRTNARHVILKSPLRWIRVCAGSQAATEGSMIEV
jgi:hypothetical protein